jgi:hypothetical protein
MTSDVGALLNFMDKVQCYLKSDDSNGSFTFTVTRVSTCVSLAACAQFGRHLLAQCFGEYALRCRANWGDVTLMQTRSGCLQKLGHGCLCAEAVTLDVEH